MIYAETPAKSQIIWAHCGLNGRKYEIPPMFIVASKKSYNKKSKSFNAFILTSEKDKYNYFRLNHGIPLINDDILGEDIKLLNKETVVLVDRFLRIEKEDLFERTQSTIKVTPEKFQEITEKFIQFINPSGHTHHLTG